MRSHHLRKNARNGIALIAAALALVSAAPNASAQQRTQPGAMSVSQFYVGQKLYVSINKMNVRSYPEVSERTLAGTLSLNDQVELVETDRHGSDQFVAVSIVQSAGMRPSNQIVYVSAKNLSASFSRSYLSPRSTTETFVVTNVATEMIRVYRRCQPGEGCINKMIFETRGTNGQNEESGDRRTDLGAFRITSWHKFYEVPGVYSGWYREEYPAMPGLKDDRGWMKKLDGFTAGRGAFGWYTAKIAPDGNGQWFHGTRGWGADKRRYVDFKDSFQGALTSAFGVMNRSHGCTSMDNESIAFMRENLPVGSDYFKIYALETQRDPSGSAYPTSPGTFNYILTKNGAGKTNGDHERPGQELVVFNGTPREEWLEAGSLTYDQHPDAIPYRGNGSKKGDLYKIGRAAFTGVFVVDDGQIFGYEHPQAIRVGGYKESDGRSKYPNYLIAQ